MSAATEERIAGATAPGRIHRALRLASVVRLRPYDVSTAAGRSQERYRRAALTTLAMAVARGLSILTVLVSIPLAVGYLGSERYGLWATISTVIALFGFADAGLGNGLVNALSRAHARDDRDEAARFVSSAFFMLAGIAGVLAVIFAVAYAWIPWSDVFNVSSRAAAREAGPSTAVFVGCFLANFPLGVVERVQLGYQEGYLNGLWQALGSVLGLGGVLLVIALRAGLPWLVFAMAGGPVLTAGVNGLVLFFRRRPWLRPRLRLADRRAARAIVGLGVMFLLLQLSATLTFSSDNLIVARLFGAAAVTDYYVPLRLFSIAPMLLFILFMPLWPAYGEALARGDMDWARRTLIRSLLTALGVTLGASAILIGFGVPIVHLWVGSTVTPSGSLLLGLGVWSVLFAVGYATSMFLNGANVIRFQAIVGIVLAATAVVAKIAFGRWIGLSGVIWGTDAAYAVVAGIPIGLVIWRRLRSAPTSVASALPVHGG